MTDEQIPHGDPSRGAAIFTEHCAFCHSLVGAEGHKKGPNLSGLWGRNAQSAPDFKYVESEERKGIVWDDKSLFSFFTGPHIPGTKFIFDGLKENKQERADLLSYLKEETKPSKEE